MMNLKDNCMITVSGVVEQDEDQETAELITRGHFTLRDGNYYITYMESETTGFAGSVTTLKIAEDAHIVSLLRHGTAPTHLIIEKGVRHLCHYDTGYGSINLGILADEIESELTEAGGSVRFSYTLDSGNEALLSRNMVSVKVKRLS